MSNLNWIDPLGGGIEKVKSKRPFSKGFIKMNRDARKALATGEVASQEIKKKMERDLRTMYIRFKVDDFTKFNSIGRNLVSKIRPYIFINTSDLQGKAPIDTVEIQFGACQNLKS